MRSFHNSLVPSGNLAVEVLVARLPEGRPFFEHRVSTAAMSFDESRRSLSAGQWEAPDDTDEARTGRADAGAGEYMERFSHTVKERLKYAPCNT